MTTADAPIVRHLIISGRVQGVGYRAWVEYEAVTRGLEGFVRNRRDGTVEALLAGPADVVAEMVDACRQGPPGARVSDIAQTDAGPEVLAQRRRAERFSVLPTA